jgi:hypothetical protein
MVDNIKEEILKLRLDYSRDNPVIGDKFILFRSFVVIAAGGEETIQFNVPQGLNVYIVSWAGNYNANSEWTLIVDDETIESRTAPPQSLQDHQKVYTPALIAHNKIEIKINNNDTIPHEYVVEVRGWQRK